MKIKNDYFKHTTRTLLTEKQKIETIEAIERGCQHLQRILKRYRTEEITPHNLYQLIYTARRRMIYLSRWTNFIKGYTQPKYLYRRRRRAEISHRAYLIVRDTGADFEEVSEKFFALMANYVRPDFK